MKKSYSIFLLMICIAFFACEQPVPKYKDPSVSIDMRIEDVLSQMTLDEKIAMLSGDSTGFNGSGVSRLGIPAILMSDGPVGVRTGSATAYPVSVNMASSWDTTLIREFGVALAEETLAKGKTVILGPCVGIQRFALGGRNFESFGEDPFLSSRMAVSYIKGVQSKNVIATVKHFACNDQEWERNNYDVQVDERSLHEVHLQPFEAAVNEAGVKALMSSYNIINHQHASENQHLLNDILKNQWGFKGIVMSDWVSVYSAAVAANNGLDLEMPKAIWFGDSLRAAIKSGKVKETIINDKIRRHLRVRFESGWFDKALPVANQKAVETDAHKNLALKMAQKSIILLENKNHALPLDKNKIKSIAVIGPYAKEICAGGGGSSMVVPWHKVSPYQGIRAAAGSNVQVDLAEGISIAPFEAVAIPSQYLKTPDGKKHGLLGEYFNNQKCEGKPELTRVDSIVNFDFGDGSPDKTIHNNNFSIRWTGKFVPPTTRKYKLALKSDDGSLLYVNDKLVVDNGGDHGDEQKSGEMLMEAGKEYNIRIVYNENGGGAAVRLMWKDPKSEQKDPTIDDAVALAQKSDVAVVCVGNSMLNEGEGNDVLDFQMLLNQEALVQAVAKVNSNTVVVVFGGVPVSVENWLADVKALLVAGYPGQEGGTAIAQILFGDVNPSGKLPYSYIQNKSQSEAFKEYKNKDLKVHYSEGVFVGYKFYERNQIKPLFPFGYGLSYTQFEYSDIQSPVKSGTNVSISLKVKNTGSLAGDEIVQLYLSHSNAKVPTPIKELKAFTRVSLKAGETKTVTLTLNEKSLRYWDSAAKKWAVDPGKYGVSVGTSSADIKLQTNFNL